MLSGWQRIRQYVSYLCRQMVRCSYWLYGLVLLVMFWTCKPAPQSSDGALSAERIPTAVMQYETTHTPDFLMGLFEPAQHSDFVQIDEVYADRAGMLMQRQAYDAFREMHAAAKAAGIDLVIRSATRNHNYQKGIWERKWTGKTLLSDNTNAATDIADDVARARKILEYSSMPGSSRHHWGTDIDLNAFNNAYFEAGEGKRVFEWLATYAEAHGYARPYTPKGTDRPVGYEEERWHWSYLPMSTTMTRDAGIVLHDTMITGFEGAHTATEIGIVDNYILGIHQSCKAWH